MADKQFIVVAYDISDDRRRTRLHNLLLDYGTPVQYSVFECLLDEHECDQMRGKVKRLVRPRLDQVRYYFLCGNCRARIQVIGERDDLLEGTEPIVI